MERHIKREIITYLSLNQDMKEETKKFEIYQKELGEMFTEQIKFDLLHIEVVAIYLEVEWR